MKALKYIGLGGLLVLLTMLRLPERIFARHVLRFFL